MQIVSCLNSQSIILLSSDDLNPLTLGYFLISDIMPKNNLREMKVNCFDRYQLIQQYSSIFCNAGTKNIYNNYSREIVGTSQ